MLTTLARIVAGATFVVTLVACPSPTTASVATVTILGGDRTTAQGTSLTLSATVETIGDASSTVTWTSSDDSVATIDADGHVTAHATGTTDITATSTADPSKSDSITITVTEPGGVTSVTINEGDQSIAVGGTLTLIATIETTGDADDTITWSSSNEDVATIDASGNITGHTAGTTIITATSTADLSKSDSITITVDPPGNHRWTRQFGTNRGDFARGIATDASGNVYVTGNTYGALKGTDRPGGDVYIRSYTGDGTQRWTWQSGWAGDDHGSDITTDDEGNVFVAGSMPGRSASGTPNRDAFIRSFDSDGDRRWRRSVVANSRDVIATGITADADGNVYVTGYTDAALEGTNAGGMDAFIVSFGNDGSYRWRRQFGTSSNETATGIATDANGNVYATGYTDGALEGLNADSSDAFIRSYDSGGALRWTRQFGTSSYDVAYGISADANGYVYAAGYTLGALEGANAGNLDAFIRSYDSSGRHRWTRQFGTGSSDVANGIATDAHGNIYATGYTGGDLEGPNAGGDDAFIRSYDSSGTDRWTRLFGTGSFDVARGIATNANGSIYATGYTGGALEGSSAGGEDAFIRSYGP